MSNDKTTRPQERVASCDPIWSALRAQAEQLAAREPDLSGFAHATILKHDRLEQALSYHLARKIGGDDVSPMIDQELSHERLIPKPGLV